MPRKRCTPEMVFHNLHEAEAVLWLSPRSAMFCERYIRKGGSAEESAGKGVAKKRPKGTEKLGGQECAIPTAAQL